jgi:hypothetical protein
MRQFIDQNDGRLTLKCGIQIELMQGRTAIVNQLGRQHLQAFQQSGSFLAAMGFRQTDNDVNIFAPSFPGCQQHGIGLTYAGYRTEKYL